MLVSLGEMATSPLNVSQNPDVNLAEIEAAGGKGAEVIQSSFEDLVNDLESSDDSTSAEEKTWLQMWFFQSARQRK